MNGLDLSERFYRASADELFEGMADIRARHAAGLVGEGSECFGFDDALSRDHDWGPAFCIWLDADDFDAVGGLLQDRYDRIAARGFNGIAARIDRARSTGVQRIGILRIDAFYAQLLRSGSLPSTLDEWRTLPESGLACAVNGRVFEDGLGRFTEMRSQLEAYYPEDIRLRKIANGCMHAAQAGQYNFIRQSQRGEDVAALQALAEFADAAMQIAYALAHRYRPFYKWAHRGLKDLGAFGSEVANRLDALLDAYRTGSWRTAASEIESLCVRIAEELRSQGLSKNADAFLIPHGIEVNAHISDDAYRRSDLMSV